MHILKNILQMSRMFALVSAVLGVPLMGSAAAGLSRDGVAELKRTLKARPAKPNVVVPTKTKTTPHGTFAKPPLKPTQNNGTHKVDTTASKKAEVETPSKIALSTEKELMQKIKTMTAQNMYKTHLLIEELSGLNEQDKASMRNEYAQKVKELNAAQLSDDARAAKLRGLKKEYDTDDSSWRLTPAQKTRIHDAFHAKAQTLQKSK